MIQRLGFATGGVLVGLAFAGRGTPQVAQYPYEYAAKIVCGMPNPELVSLVPQRYATTINVHNPSDSTAMFFKKVALTVPLGRQRPGKVIKIAVDTLIGDQALVVDCLDLQRRLGVGPFFEGFVVLLSPMSLDVTGVCTVPGGIDVEQIHERARVLR